MDDGSSRSGTEEIARSFGDRVRYARQENQKLAAARNSGIALASGDWVALLDHDDIFFPDKLEKQLAVIEANPNLVLLVYLGIYLSLFRWKHEGDAVFPGGGPLACLALSDADPAFEHGDSTLCADGYRWVQVGAVCLQDRGLGHVAPADPALFEGRFLLRARESAALPGPAEQREQELYADGAECSLHDRPPLSERYERAGEVCVAEEE